MDKKRDKTMMSHFREMGKRGGRPKLPTLEELHKRQQSSPETQIKIKGEEATRAVLASNNLKELREMWRLRNKTSGGA